MRYINILYWALYQIIFLSFIVPSFTIGGLIVDDKCLNNALVPLFIWFFVYGSAMLVVNMATIPIMNLLFTNTDAIKSFKFDNIPLWYKVSAIIGCIFLTFSLAWLGFGVYIYSLVNECAYVHATKLLLSYILIWLIILSIILILALIGFIVYCIFRTNM